MSWEFAWNRPNLHAGSERNLAEICDQQMIRINSLKSPAKAPTWNPGDCFLQDTAIIRTFQRAIPLESTLMKLAMITWKWVSCLVLLKWVSLETDPFSISHHLIRGCHCSGNQVFPFQFNGKSKVQNYLHRQKTTAWMTLQWKCIMGSPCVFLELTF